MTSILNSKAITQNAKVQVIDPNFQNMTSTLNSNGMIQNRKVQIINQIIVDNSADSGRPKRLPITTKAQVCIRLFEDSLKAPSLVERNGTS